MSSPRRSRAIIRTSASPSPNNRTRRCHAYINNASPTPCRNRSNKNFNNNNKNKSEEEQEFSERHIFSPSSKIFSSCFGGSCVAPNGNTTTKNTEFEIIPETEEKVVEKKVEEIVVNTIIEEEMKDVSRKFNLPPLTDSQKQLLFACKTGYFLVAKSAIENSCNENNDSKSSFINSCIDEQGYTALHHSCKEGNFDLLKYFCSFSFLNLNIESENETRETPLISAISSSNSFSQSALYCEANCVSCLLQNGADAFKKDATTNQFTALDYAAMYGHIDTVVAILHYCPETVSCLSSHTQMKLNEEKSLRDIAFLIEEVVSKHKQESSSCSSTTSFVFPTTGQLFAEKASENFVLKENQKIIYFENEFKIIEQNEIISRFEIEFEEDENFVKFLQEFDLRRSEENFNRKKALKEFSKDPTWKSFFKMII